MKWKHLLRYPFDIRKANSCLQSNAQPVSASGNRAICFDLYTDQLLFDCGRHLACIASYARRIDSEVVLRCSKLMLAAIAHKDLGADFLSMEHVRWITPQETFPKHSLVFLDVARGAADRELVDVQPASMLIGREFLDGIPVMPYPMFPTHIAAANREHLDRLRRKPKAGVFFCGNQQLRYGKDSMRESFDVLPRLQILATLRKHFADRIEVRNAGGRRDRIVLRDSSINPIEPAKWLPSLADHRFFIACPGASQPVCHNLIESMSVGLVPILEHADRLSPPLVDGKNAICYRGAKGLVDAIVRIDRMTPAELQQLSAGAMEYYDAHLDGARFLSRVRDCGLLDSTGAVVMPFHNEDFFDPAAVPPGSRAAA